MVGFVVDRFWFGLVIENLAFCGFWFVFLVWVCCGVIDIADGFVGFVGGRWLWVCGFC